MPDFERVTRSLELHLAESAEEKMYVKGTHDGQDQARKQVLLGVLSGAAVWLVINAYLIG